MAGRADIRLHWGADESRSRQDQYSVGQLRYDLIVIDELSYLSFSHFGGHLVLHLISKLYENISLLITTNLDFADWPQHSATPG